MSTINNDPIDRNPYGNNEDLSTILKVVSFCIPLVGGILWFVKKDDEPVAAKSAGKLALFGLALGIILQIISVVLGGLFGLAG